MRNLKMRLLHTTFGAAIYARFVVPHYLSFVRLNGDEVKRILLPKGDFDQKFIGDPFLFRWDGANWLFFEGLYANRGNRGRSKGVIGCFKQVEDRWEFVGKALEEPWHLSYPQVFSRDGHVYMIPESGCAGEVALYEALQFPFRWKKLKVIISGNYVDSTLLMHDNSLYLFATPEDALFRSELWTARSLTGEWHKHPQSDNVSSSLKLRRNGGSFIRSGEKLYRIAQDCDGGYGKCLYRIPVLEISPSVYREGTAELLADAISWPQHMMHHTYNRIEDGGNVVEIIDCHYNTFKRPLSFLLSALWFVLDGLRYVFYGRVEE